MSELSVWFPSKLYFGEALEVISDIISSVAWLLFEAIMKVLSNLNSKFWRFLKYFFTWNLTQALGFASHNLFWKKLITLDVSKSGKTDKLFQFCFTNFKKLSKIYGIRAKYSEKYDLMEILFILPPPKRKQKCPKKGRMFFPKPYFSRPKIIILQKYFLVLKNKLLGKKFSPFFFFSFGGRIKKQFPYCKYKKTKNNYATKNTFYIRGTAVLFLESLLNCKKICNPTHN